MVDALACSGGRTLVSGSAAPSQLRLTSARIWLVFYGGGWSPLTHSSRHTSSYARSVRIADEMRHPHRYQRPRRFGNRPVYGHGLSRAVGAPGSASQNFILGTNLEFRPTQTVHRRSSPKTQYRQITNRGFGGIRSTSTSISGALAEVCFSPVALTDSSVATFGLTSASRGSLTTAYLPFRLILAGKSVLISNSISTFLLSALPPPILLLYFPELLM